MWLELNSLAENDCQIFPDQFSCLYTMHLSEYFSSEKAIKKLALQYRLMWIRWLECSQLVVESESFFVAVPKMHFLFETKGIPVWMALLMLLVTVLYRERLPQVFQMSFCQFKEVLHLWRLVVFLCYNFPEHLKVVNPTWLSRWPKFLVQVSWCSSCWSIQGSCDVSMIWWDQRGFPLHIYIYIYLFILFWWLL